MKIIEALVACSDLAGYAKFAGRKSAEEIFELLAEYYEFVGDVIASANGRVIKFMGDASLIIFDDHNVDSGIIALLALQKEGDHFLSKRGLASRHHIRAHYGPVCLGDLGTQKDKRPDILGTTVNTVFLLKSAGGFTITPEVFRKLKSDTRKAFKKHTPPITYIPIDQPHRD